MSDTDYNPFEPEETDEERSRRVGKMIRDNVDARLAAEARQRPIGELESGTRVRKLSAIMFDFAFGRVGTVVREDGHLGVLWDGGRLVIEYPPDTQVVPEAD